MKFDAYHSGVEEATIIHGSVPDIDLRRAFDPRLLQLEVRTIVASRIADIVMAKLAPAIEAALKEIS